MGLGFFFPSVKSPACEPQMFVIKLFKILHSLVDLPDCEEVTCVAQQEETDVPSS